MQQIVAIQALRALAALAVVFGHAQSEALAIAARRGEAFASIALNVTGAGVDLFFIISGFVMVHASSGLFAASGGSGVFMARRVARIVPLYWCATALYLAVMFATPQLLGSDAPLLMEIVQSYLFIPYHHPGATLMQPVYKLGWTLNYEMFFYLVFACCIVLPMRNAVVALTLCFSGLVASSLLWAPAYSPLSYWGHPIVLEFVAGAWLAVGYARGLRLNQHASMGLAIAALAGLVIAAQFDLYEGTIWRPVLFGAPAALLFIAFVFRAQPYITPKFLAAMGDASYALYLVHPIVIRVMRRLSDWAVATHALDTRLFVAICLIISVFLAFVVYRLFERPVTRILQHLLLPARPLKAANA